MKSQLREKFKIKRRFFGPVLREEADRLIADYFIRAYGSYQSFFIYNSFGTEADTKKLIAKLLSLGKKVYLPRTEGKNISAVPYGELKKGRYGIEEPIGEAYCGVAEVTVVPLLAVNPRGYRLGYGGGYYDRYLSRKGKNMLKIGICYDFQLVGEVPSEEHDVLLDALVTDARVIVRETSEVL